MFIDRCIYYQKVEKGGKVRSKSRNRDNSNRKEREKENREKREVSRLLVKYRFIYRSIDVIKAYRRKKHSQVNNIKKERVRKEDKGIKRSKF